MLKFLIVLTSTQISSLYSDYDSVVTRAGYVYGTVNENGTLNHSSANATITSVSFASYGTPNGSDGKTTIGGCHVTNSQTIVENYCVGNNSCSIPAKNAVFGDLVGELISVFMLRFIILTNEKDLFYLFFFLLTLTVYSQIRTSSFGFSTPSSSWRTLMVLVLKMLQAVHIA